MSSATVEELAYYGITHILAYGLAGGLGTRGLAMGDFYLVETALAADGTTPHYTRDTITSADAAAGTGPQHLDRRANDPGSGRDRRRHLSRR